MITPRRTRLLRAPDLSGFRSHLVELAAGLDAAAAADTFVIVPTRAAAAQLRRTLAAHGLPRASDRPLPHLGTRSDFYDLLASRLAHRPRMLSPFEREALLSAAARDAEESGVAPPFHVRPTLVAEMIGLYDQIRWLHRSVDDFDRLLCGELEPAAESDRGAAQLLEQTRFLVAAFRGYEARLLDGGGSDEHALRHDLIATPAPQPVRRVTVTVGDRLSDPEGLWPADVALITIIPGLESIDLLATDGVLAAGYLDRLHLAFVGIEGAAETQAPAPAPLLVVPPAVALRLGGDDASPPPRSGQAPPLGGDDASPPPRSGQAPPLGGDDASPPPRSGQAHQQPVVFSYRDREDELEGVARRLKADRRAGRQGRLDRAALVVSRALPYLYVARDVFAGAGVPFQALDTLPLAAEPYAAALDLVIEFVATGFTRRATTALLRSPHFRFEAPPTKGVPPQPLDRKAVSALDAALVELRFLGGLDRLSAVVGEWVASAPTPLFELRRGLAEARGAKADKATADQASPIRGSGREHRRQQAALPAATAAIELATLLAPLTENRPLLEHLELLLSFLDRYERPSEDERRERARSGVLAAIAGLVDGYKRHDPGATGTVHDLSAAIRRWLGAQTFAIRSRDGGLQIVDAQAARFGEFDDVQLMGLVEGEWPERPRRNVFYPQALLAQLEPARPDRVALHEERDLLRAARASFRDLTMLARSRTRLSTFALEADAVVEPSVFVEDAAAFGLATETAIGHDEARVFVSEALQAQDTPEGISLPALTNRWAAARRARGDADPSRFLGQAGEWTLPRVSVSRLERYLKCPFQFYVANVLQIEEEREDEDTRSPLERGRFLHELFETFFHEWQARGHSRITPDTIGDAEALFAEVCGPALASLAPSEAGLERARLFGSAVGPGIASRVFAMEAERDAGIDERLMEYELDGEFTFAGADGAARTVPLRAKIDRVDVLIDGTFRLIDYKTKYVPDVKTALQLPIYSACVRTGLSRERGRDIPASEAMYLSFEGKRGIVALERKGASFAELVTEAEHRLVGALNDIAAGHFPARPDTKSLCTMCGFVTICRTPGGAEQPEDLSAEAPGAKAAPEGEGG